MRVYTRNKEIIKELGINKHAADIHELESLRVMVNISYKAKTSNNVLERIIAESIS